MHIFNKGANMQRFLIFLLIYLYKYRSYFVALACFLIFDTKHVEHIPSYWLHFIVWFACGSSWLSDLVFDLWPKGSGFEYHSGHRRLCTLLPAMLIIGLLTSVMNIMALFDICMLPLWGEWSLGNVTNEILVPL